MINNILVLGAGSAGLLAALSLKRRFEDLEVRIVRSMEIGTIGVGEGTTPNFPRHLFDNLLIDRAGFYEMAEPTWKTGIRFLWGPRHHFDYTFTKQIDSRWTDLGRSNGYFCDEEFRCADLISALLAQDKAFPRSSRTGGPDIMPCHGFHIENRKLISTLEIIARQAGITIIDARWREWNAAPKGLLRFT